MPTYNQIADYINNRRKALGDNNDIDVLKEFVDINLIYDPDKTDINELFVFGTDNGTGQDKNHFHCGFTSIRLLQQIKGSNGIRIISFRRNLSNNQIQLPFN